MFAYSFRFALRAKYSLSLRPTSFFSSHFQCFCLIWTEQEQHDYIYCNEWTKKKNTRRIIIKCISILASIYWQCLICEYFCCFVMYTHFDDRTHINEHTEQIRLVIHSMSTWNENKKKLIFFALCCPSWLSRFYCTQSALIQPNTQCIAMILTSWMKVWQWLCS